MSRSNINKKHLKMMDYLFESSHCFDYKSFNNENSFKNNKINFNNNKLKNKSQNNLI